MIGLPLVNGEPVSMEPPPPVNDKKIAARSDGEMGSPVRQTRASGDRQKKEDRAPDRRSNKQPEVEPAKETAAVRKESESISGLTGPDEPAAEERQTVSVSARELKNPLSESRPKTGEPEGAGKKESIPPRQEGGEPGPEEEIRYFTKTADLMGKEAPDPVRIREVLFREVWEWVADGPALEIAGDTVLERDAPPGAAEGDIVAIQGTRSVESGEPAERWEKEGIEEQSFNLSIGTISVIIEGGDSPPPVNPINREHGRETRPKSSRLRRNYL